MKIKLHIGLALACILFAGIANGTMDKLQFHFGKSRLAKVENQQYWNPQISWENKWSKTAEGKLAQPLRPAFPGSTTVFVWLTDGWHLMKFLYHGFARLALVLSLSLPYVILKGKAAPWWAYPAAWLVLAGLQAVGFHITYTLIF
jgi:hypothetical protein